MLGWFGFGFGNNSKKRKDAPSQDEQDTSAKPEVFEPQKQPKTQHRLCEAENVVPTIHLPFVKAIEEFFGQWASADKLQTRTQISCASTTLDACHALHTYVTDVLHVDKERIPLLKITSRIKLVMANGRAINRLQMQDSAITLLEPIHFVFEADKPFIRVEWCVHEQEARVPLTSMFLSTEQKGDLVLQTDVPLLLSTEQMVRRICRTLTRVLGSNKIHFHFAAPTLLCRHVQSFTTAHAWTAACLLSLQVKSVEVDMGKKLLLWTLNMPSSFTDVTAEPSVLDELFDSQIEKPLVKEALSGSFTTLSADAPGVGTVEEEE